MKKLLAILLIVVLVFIMTSCGSKEVSISKLYSELSKAGYEILEDEPNLYSAEDFGITSRIVTNINSCEIWRGLDSGAGDDGTIIFFECASEEDAIYAYETIMKNEAEYYEIDFEVKEGRNYCRAVLPDEYKYCEFFMLSRIGSTIICVLVDYESFEDVGESYDYLLLDIFNRLGY